MADQATKSWAGAKTAKQPEKSYRLAPGEDKQIADALAELVKDPHAPRSLSVKVNLHVHNEYPKLLYKGVGGKDSVTVKDAAGEEQAIADGYGAFAPVPAEE